jgi:hypothetical protein
MKSAKLMCITVVALLVALAIPVSLAAQEHKSKHQTYKLIDLGALPGVNSSFANWISPKGLVAGFSENSAIDPLLGVPEVDAVL